MKVTVYSKNDCMPCHMTKQYLKNNNIDFDEINIEAPGNENKVFDVVNLGYSTMPAVVIKNDDGTQESFAGFNVDKLDDLRDRNNK